jgi:LPS export ABC transporter protein LptC
MRSAAQRARALRRRLVNVAAILATALAGYGILGGRGDDKIEVATTNEDRGYYLTDARLTEMGPDGSPRIVLHAASVEQRLSEQTVLLSDLEIDYRSTEAGTWTVTADRGRLLPDGTSLMLSGDVLIRGTEARGTAVIRTDNLAYNTQTSVIQTSEPVSLQFGPHSLEGRGLRVSLNAATLRLESNVHGLFKP